MARVTLSITTKPAQFAAGTKLSGFRFRVVAAGGKTAEEITLDQSAVFGEVPDGTYTATVAALDGAGKVLAGSEFTVQFIVAATTGPVTLSIPAGLTVAVE